MHRLHRSFFTQPTLNVAAALLGQILVFKDQRGLITETEAYMGFADPASHAARGLTQRTAMMFGEAGFAYVYLIYGMYHCLNFVTEGIGFPAAVLIRGVKILDESGLHLNGPGKICRHFGITTKDNGTDITQSSELYVDANNITVEFTTTPRMGIKKGQNLPWRYVAKNL